MRIYLGNIFSNECSKKDISRKYAIEIPEVGVFEFIKDESNTFEYAELKTDDIYKLRTVLNKKIEEMKSN